MLFIEQIIKVYNCLIIYSKNSGYIETVGRRGNIFFLVIQKSSRMIYVYTLVL